MAPGNHIEMHNKTAPMTSGDSPAEVVKQPLPQEEEEEEKDPISQCVGEFGRWQLVLTFLLSLFNIPCTWHIFAPTFQSPAALQFWCARPEALQYNLTLEKWRQMSHIATVPAPDGSLVPDACWIKKANYSSGSVSEIISELLSSSNETMACTEWDYDESEFGYTVISQWKLVCDRRELTNVAEMMFLVGVTIGGLASGFISDRFGRKKTLFGSMVLQISTAIIMAFAPWFGFYLVLRFILGFISVSVVFSGFVLCMEMVGGKWRTISGVSYLFPVPLSYIAMAGIAYVVKGWTNLQLAITVPSIILLGLFWVLPESPLWLLALGRKEQVIKILEGAAECNKRELPANIDKILQQSISEKTVKEEPKAGVMDLFRTPTLRKISFVLYIVWFSVYLLYYGLVLNLGNIGSDVYLNTVISGVVEVPAIAISIFCLLKTGRRWPFCVTLAGSGIACLITLAVPLGRKDLEWVTVMFAMIGKFLVSSSNAIMPVFTAELFPTVIRNLGVGASNLPAGVALILVPYLWNLSGIDPRLPMLLLGVFGVLGGMSVLLLPETANKTLAANVEEEEERVRRRSIAERQRKQSNATVRSNGTVP